MEQTKNNGDFKLKGSPYQQGQQMAKAIVNNEVTFDAIKDSITISANFIKGVIDCVKQEMEHNQNMDKVVVSAISCTINSMNSYITDDTIPSDERLKAMEYLQRLCDGLSQYRKEQDKRSFLKQILWGLMALVTIVISLKVVDNNKPSFR